MVELQVNQPRWRRVHAIIVERIRRGEYKAGERIPSLVDLIEEFGIANVTGQKVMRALRADGLIRTEPGMGSFVTTAEERKDVEAAQVKRSKFE
ncbi:winged helix-turn-helix domain-containing protein [Nonomuraea rubra]|uniref:DNA-binding GntR family transcriptional regulator n=1 Tax=Nonomuraea rubra TaxID=46180 RepID=A0A7X0NME2_9ACTN|nr:winged helix-turn-helix domain-containing protein [Nonomuraea rubra]MBB6546128.1 DNA-binding GntR family transcriptional regulator [Nonomuraea rubra]